MVRAAFLCDRGLKLGPYLVVRLMDAMLSAGKRTLANAVSAGGGMAARGAGALALAAVWLGVLGRLWLRKRRREIFTGVAIAGCLLVAMAIVADSRTAFEYSYHGRVLGVVERSGMVDVAVEKLKETTVQEDGVDVEIVIDKQKDIVVSKVTLPLGTPKKTDTEEDVISNISAQQDIEIKAYEIAIDGKRLGVVTSEAEADALLKRVTAFFLGAGDQSAYNTVAFVEAVQIREIQIAKTFIEKSDILYDRVLAGTVNAKTYTVRDGDTVYDISLANGVTEDNLEQWNPDLDPLAIQAGNTLQIQEKTSLLHVRTTENAAYEADIAFEVVYQDTDAMYEGEEEIVVPGVLGKKDVVGEIVRINGAETERIEHAVTVIEPSSPQTVRRGTKPVPPRIGTGTYVYPIYAEITSGFGQRWGRLHDGTDFGTSVGTNVYASDGGRVIFAGYSGGYGKTIKIDHGAGIVTLYGHLSEYLVSEGDMVTQGQHIAASGNTGNSTGPHLHFSLYKFGIAQNPLDYIK
jgi:murein DD-endopeptidase MepM/ murein hydrolase activator NlpD